MDGAWRWRHVLHRCLLLAPQPASHLGPTHSPTPQGPLEQLLLCHRDPTDLCIGIASAAENASICELLPPAREQLPGQSRPITVRIPGSMPGRKWFMGMARSLSGPGQQPICHSLPLLLLQESSLELFRQGCSSLGQACIPAAFRAVPSSESLGK